MDPVIVVGAGISGVVCARTLNQAGVPVTVLDRGHRIGGRMATRTLDGRPVDTGASYFTVSEPRFEAVVEDWRSRGLAHHWTETFSVLGDGREPMAQTKSGPVRWGTPGGLRTLVEDHARGLDVRRVDVAGVRREQDTWLVDGTPASAVVLAMPDAQARRLLGQEVEVALDRDFEPALVLSAWWEGRTWPSDFDGGFVNDHDVLAWVADDGRRRGDGAPLLVAHSTPDFARAHLEDPESTTPEMVAALRDVMGIQESPVGTHVQRWSLAKPSGERDESHLLTDTLLGVCGDGWGPQSKVEGGWLSGLALGEALAARLG